jgi:hypothetical protein
MIHDAPDKFGRDFFREQVVTILDEDGFPSAVLDIKFLLDQAKGAAIFFRATERKTVHVTVDTPVETLAAQMTVGMSHPRIHIADAFL